MSKMNIPIEAEFLQAMISPTINGETIYSSFVLRKVDDLYIATGQGSVMMFVECPSDSDDLTYKTIKGISLKLIYKKMK